MSRSSPGFAWSLRWKLLAFALAISSSVVVGSWLMQRWLVQPQFAAIEAREAETNLARVRDAVANEAEVVARSAQDYGAWDDTLRFLADGNGEYLASNFVPETLVSLATSFVLIVDREGRERFSGRRVEGHDALQPDPRLVAELIAADGLIGHAAPDSRRSGILRTHHGVALVGCAAITNSAKLAPVSGTMVFGRFLDAEGIAALSEQLRVSFTLASLDGATGEVARAAERVAESGTPWLDDRDANTLVSYALLDDLAGEPVLIARAELPRETSRRAAAAAQLTTLAGVLGGAALLAGMWLVLAHFVLRPVERLTKHAVGVAASGDLGARIGLASRDEIGTLAREFDGMVAQLERSRADGLELARRAGRSEIASAVLHDIGNVLNSATVSARVVADTLSRSELESLRRAASLLRANAGRLPEFLASDARGQHLLPYLEEVVEALEAEQQRALGEMKTLGATLEHVATLVRAQSRNTHAAPLREALDPTDVARQAAALASDSFAQHGIAFSLESRSSERAALDRHRCLQVLANLLANAKHAVVATERGTGKIALHVARSADADGAWVEFAVSDDGIGIDPESCTRIFALGFTTRAEGQGIGLHSAANLAREMGGSLRVESAGVGRGATFTLRVPARPEPPQ